MKLGNRTLLLGVALVVVLPLVSCSSLAVNSLTPPGSIVLINGKLIDGTGANPVSDAVVVIQGDRILAVGSQDTTEIPTGARSIDIRGGTILPGLINAHVHDGFNEENLKAWAQGGVTTVRDEAILSGRPRNELMALRDAWSRNPQCARLISAGYMLTVPNGYGGLFVQSPEDARQEVVDELEAGADLIKLSMEDGIAGVRGMPKLSSEELQTIIAVAHEHGVPVSGHVTEARYLEILIDAGVDDIAHVPYDPVALTTWQRMVEKGIYLVPTFTVFRNYGAPVSTCVQNLRSFVAKGGQVALGNDYDGGRGEFELGIPMYEIEKMAEAGMTPSQIIIACTRNAAHVAGVEDKLGTLQSGKIADMLIVKGDPSQNIKDLGDIWIVIHDGVIIRQEGN